MYSFNNDLNKQLLREKIIYLIIKMMYVKNEVCNVWAISLGLRIALNTCMSVMNQFCYLHMNNESLESSIVRHILKYLV